MNSPNLPLFNFLTFGEFTAPRLNSRIWMTKFSSWPYLQENASRNQGTPLQDLECFLEFFLAWVNSSCYTKGVTVCFSTLNSSTVGQCINVNLYLEMNFSCESLFFKLSNNKFLTQNQSKISSLKNYFGEKLSLPLVSCKGLGVTKRIREIVLDGR